MGGEEGCLEPKLSHGQNIKVRDRQLQVAGRHKYFLSAWMDITLDRKIFNMVKHLYQQYPKPRIRFNSEEAAIIDGEIQKLLSIQE